jgi:ParB family chromosome partitioning protein
MAILQTGLGKGLNGLIRNTQTEADNFGPATLPVDDIRPNPRQPRRDFSSALEELAASIRSQGLLQPLLVRPLGTANPGKYEIVAGERRWRACKLAGLTEIPAVIRPLSEQDTLVAALIENLQREDLNPLEEALGMQALKQEFGLSQEDIAQKLGKSRPAVANSLRLLTLPESMHPLLADRTLSPGHAKALLGIGDDTAKETLKQLILDRHLSVRETEGLAAAWKKSGSFPLAYADGTEAPPTPSDGLPGRAAADGTFPGTAQDVAPYPQKRDAGSQSAILMELQSRIGSLFSLPVKITGKEDRGRISFAYNSKEELKALVLRLSSRIRDGRAAPALDARDDSALDGKDDPVLNGSAASALDGKADPILDGRDDPALDGKDDPVLNGNAVPAPDGKADPVLNGRIAPSLSGRIDPAPDGRTSPAPEGTGNSVPPGGESSTQNAPPEALSEAPETEQAVRQEHTEAPTRDAAADPDAPEAAEALRDAPAEETQTGLSRRSAWNRAGGADDRA